MTDRRKVTTRTGKILHKNFRWEYTPERGNYLIPKDDSVSSFPLSTRVKSLSPIIIGDKISPTSFSGVTITQSGSYSKNTSLQKSNGDIQTCIFNENYMAPYVRPPINSSFSITYPGHNPFSNASIRATAQMAGVNFNAAVALAETRSTADTLTNVVNRIGRIGLAVKNLKLSTVRREIKALRHLIVGHTAQGRITSSRYKKMMRKRKLNANDTPESLWLEYRYGIMPLVYDADAIRKALSGKVERPMLKSVSSYEVVEYNNERGNLTQAPGLFLSSGTIKYRVNYTVQVKSALWATASESGFTNVPLVGWELVPFSFIVDWMLPIGTYLTSLSAIPNVSFHHGCHSMRIKGTVTGSFKTSTTQSSAVVKTDAYARFPQSRFPSVLPSFQNPIRGISDIDRVADLFAIFRQLSK